MTNNLPIHEESSVFIFIGEVGSFRLDRTIDENTKELPMIN